MRLIKGIQSIKEKLTNSLCIIGNFDGLHKGHQNLIHFAKEIADKKKLHLTLLTFEPHSRVQLNLPFEGRIHSFTQKIQELKKLGIERIVLIRPCDHIFSLLPKDFIKYILIEKLDTKVLVVGEDFKFGYKRQGTCSDLLNQPFDLIRFPLYLADENEKKSSSLIKKHIQNGNLHSLEKLNFTYSVIGRVKKGNQLATKLGFPTLNISLNDLIIPKFGVYAAYVRFLNDAKIYTSIAYIGVRPTIDEDQSPLLEVHILDSFSGEAYGKKIIVTLTSFLRKEKKFENLEDLTLQIKRDIERARAA